MIARILSNNNSISYTGILFCIFLQMPILSEAQIFPNLDGDLLLEALVDNYKPTNVLNYNEARDTLYGTIDNINDSVRCIYSNHSLFLPAGVDPSIHLFMNGSPDGINAEHSYPRSKGADESNGNAYSDMHHLFPSRVSVNSARANFPFLEIDDQQTTSWFWLDQEETTVPTTNIDAYSEQINGAFEPKENSKGNIARAIFYFFTMYEAEALAADPVFFELQRETLCDWHIQDPVDVLELDRTNAIAGHQDQLPNPFIIDETLLSRSYCLAEALPVELSIFRAVEKDGLVELNWKTTSEINNKGFEIERKTADQDWQILGFVEGQGNTTTAQNYFFRDKQPVDGDNFYRLKQIDFDGGFEYSEIRVINVKKDMEDKVKISPNPSKGIFEIKIENPDRQDIQVQIFNSLGNQVWFKSFENEERLTVLEETIDFQGSGIFFLIAKIGADNFREKIMVVE